MTGGRAGAAQIAVTCLQTACTEATRQLPPGAGRCPAAVADAVPWQEGVQGAGRGHHVRRDGAGHQPAAGAGLGVGPAEARPLRGYLWRPGAPSVQPVPALQPVEAAGVTPSASCASSARAALSPGAQVCGGYVDSMTRCAQLLEEQVQVDFVDVNCGCPIDLICNKCAWHPAAVPSAERVGRRLAAEPPLSQCIRHGTLVQLQVQAIICPGSQHSRSRAGACCIHEHLWQNGSCCSCHRGVGHSPSRRFCATCREAMSKPPAMSGMQGAPEAEQAADAQGAGGGCAGRPQGLTGAHMSSSRWQARRAGAPAPACCRSPSAWRQWCGACRRTCPAP